MTRSAEPGAAGSVPASPLPPAPPDGTPPSDAELPAAEGRPGPAPSGPLRGVRVVELAGIGPAPFAAMLLADLGAEVIRVDRPTPPANAPFVVGAAAKDVVNRGKLSVALDLKHPDGRDAAAQLVRSADVLLEGFRPGVAERLGLGPAECAALNPALVYGRMTGWGQDGPLAAVAGHDIGYAALTGLLWAIGRADERPTAPLNVLGDYAGGSLFLVTGVLAALLEARRSGAGQVVDAAMVDGVGVLGTMFVALAELGVWDLGRRGVNMLDGAAPWYDVFACADGKYLAVGALEPAFYALLVERTGFRAGQPDAARVEQPGPAAWPALKAEWAALWATRSRDAWAELLGGTDACVQPVLDWAEARRHPHLAARGAHRTVHGVTQPAPAPRLSRTPAAIGGPPPAPGRDTAAVLATAGYSAARIEQLLRSGAAATT